MRWGCFRLKFAHINALSPPSCITPRGTLRPSPSSLTHLNPPSVIGFHAILARPHSRSPAGQCIAEKGQYTLITLHHTHHTHTHPLSFPPTPTLPVHHRPASTTTPRNENPNPPHPSPITWPLEHDTLTKTPTLRTRGVPVVHHSLYSAPLLPPGHRFPMPVFQVIHDTLIRDGIVDSKQIFSPPPVPSRDEVLLAHSPEFLLSFESGTLDPQAVRRIGFPWSSILVERTISEVTGTLLTAELALEYGLACNTAGGTHHAHRDFGSGFCILNDIAVTALALLRRGRVQRVAIVDLDVHQGDGTAAILKDEPRAFTFSMHCGANFPARKQQSDLDVDVPAGAGDKEFLSLLADHLPHVLKTFRPCVVLFDAGVDTHTDDALGKLNMTDEGLSRREMQVIDTCLGFGVPVACLNGGGYDDDLQVLAYRHCHLHRAAKELWMLHQL